MKKQYAFLILGDDYQPEVDQCRFETGQTVTHIRTVRTLEEALSVAKRLRAEGVGAIELCGAFGVDAARRIMEATDREVAVGYVVHDSELDSVFTRFWK